ncbi:MAG: ribonuclease H-like domain-containing protein [Blautia sp.]|nr:ribonuclease H-like domain-containing protein [Clostridia bacterium]MDY4692706.1 ribonuclease H-like domain-containing protein [Blautia sp.]MDY5554926.1 ribonuclease H-like domain-containing protein [Blautia sp.]
MIVKKMPIFQGFPDFETVKFLTHQSSQKYNFSPVFYDIETTGLSRNSTFLYMIGTVAPEGNQWYFFQWMAESREEEGTILRIFSQFLNAHTCLISYNGERFDQPYLESRYDDYRLPSPFNNISSLDLYLELKPLKNLLKLTSMKQPSLEKFLNLPKRSFPDGGECVSLYKKFLITGDSHLADILMGHNQEDVYGLGRILTMQSYLCLLNSRYESTSAVYDDGNVIFTLQLPCSLPENFSNGTCEFYIKGQEKEVRLLVKAKNRRLKRYYENFKDYYYLPEEDTIIPRALGSGISKQYRKAATKKTCYTWFSCSEQFLQDKNMQMEYLKHALPVLIESLNAAQKV